jgi:hypothetical protein
VCLFICLCVFAYEGGCYWHVCVIVYHLRVCVRESVFFLCVFAYKDGCC